MERYLKKILTVGIMALALVAMLGLQAKVVWADVTEVLIIQEDAPNNTAVQTNAEQAVIDVGKDYTKIASSTLDALSVFQLSKYKIIILVENQGIDYYKNIFNNDNYDKIARAVQSGSILIAHLGNDGGIDGFNDFLPGGVTVFTNNGYETDNISISDFSACVLQGIQPTHADLIQYFQGWDYSATGIFKNLGVVTASVVMKSNDGDAKDGPTYIIYPFGSGQVMATTQTLEGNNNTTTIATGVLKRELICAQAAVPPGPDIEKILEKIQSDITDLGTKVEVIEGKLDKLDTGTIKTTVDSIEAKTDAIEAKLDDHCPCPQPEQPQPHWPWWRHPSGQSSGGTWQPVLPSRR